jgi:deazaflavin-dependent oxidoreductase (nitroreductase family)
VSAAPSFSDANPLQKGLRRFAASGPGSWLFARTLNHVDRPVFRATRGRHTAASLLAGLPIVMLTSTGAKSAEPRTVPLVGLPVEDGGIALIGSNYGREHHPAWVHNLRAHPNAEMAVEGQAPRRVRAVEVDGDRRAEIWARALRVYPGFATYERRAAHRRLAVFVLEPR